jgi:ribonucleoside-diphosphate reductase alpha chain
MGLHELCLKNDLKYEPSGLIGRWLHTWEKVSDEEAKKVAGEMNDVVPVAVRAVAPTGTTSIIGETTSGIEPILCVSYKRRYLDKGGKWRYQYVVDPTAARLIQEGIVPDDIEDAYLLSRDVEKRLSMQVFVQEYTDQAIASTVNLPEFGEAGNNNAKRFSETLLKYLPKLRGVTVFPEGSRPGQPITPVKYETALKHKDVVFEEDGDRCKGSVCSI